MKKDQEIRNREKGRGGPEERGVQRETQKETKQRLSGLVTVQGNKAKALQ